MPFHPQKDNLFTPQKDLISSVFSYFIWMKGERSPYQHSVARSTRRLELKQYRDDPRRRKFRAASELSVLECLMRVAPERAERKE